MREELMQPDYNTNSLLDTSLVDALVTVTDDIVQTHFYNQPCTVVINRVSGVSVSLFWSDARAWIQYRTRGADNADNAVTTGLSVYTFSQSVYITHCDVSSTADQLVLKAGKTFMATAIPYTPPLLVQQVSDAFTTHCTESRRFSPEWVATSKLVAFRIVDKLTCIFEDVQLVNAHNLGPTLVMTFSHDIVMGMYINSRVHVSIDRNDIQVPYGNVESMLFPALDVWYQSKEEEIQV